MDTVPEGTDKWLCSVANSQLCHRLGLLGGLQLRLAEVHFGPSWSVELSVLRLAQIGSGFARGFEDSLGMVFEGKEKRTERPETWIPQEPPKKPKMVQYPFGKELEVMKAWNLEDVQKWESKFESLELTVRMRKALKLSPPWWVLRG